MTRTRSGSDSRWPLRPTAGVGWLRSESQPGLAQAVAAADSEAAGPGLTVNGPEAQAELAGGAAAQPARLHQQTGNYFANLGM